MPLYEYRCSKCGRVFEVLQKFAEAPLTVHDGCGGEVEQLISAPAFHLKGTGWYATDYKKTSAPVAGKSDPAGGDSKTGGEGSSDSTTDGKASDSKTSDAKADGSKSESKPAASEPAAPSTPASTKTD